MRIQLNFFLVLWIFGITVRIKSDETYPSINLEIKTFEEKATNYHKKESTEALINNNQPISDLGKRSSKCTQQIHVYESEVLNLDLSISDLQAKVLSLKSSNESRTKNLNESINEIIRKIAFLKSNHEGNANNRKKTIGNYKETLKYIEDCLNYISNSSQINREKGSDIESLIDNLNHLKISMQNAIIQEDSQTQNDIDSENIIKKMKMSLNHIADHELEIDIRKKIINQKFEESLEAMKTLQSQSQSLREALLNEKDLCNELKEQPFEKLQDKDININIYPTSHIVFDE